jgi:hypothetical protein
LWNSFRVLYGANARTRVAKAGLPFIRQASLRWPLPRMAAGLLIYSPVKPLVMHKQEVKQAAK